MFKNSHMSTQYQSSCFLFVSSSSSSHKLFLNQEDCKFFSNFHHYPPRKDFKFCICSAKKSRGTGRKVKSNVELFNDIREFLSAVGLPQGHVPTMKELYDHGRNDLAHIVRRRGYKFMRELLSNSLEVEIDGANTEKRLDEGEGSINNGVDMSKEGQDETEQDVVDSSLSTEALVEDHSGSGYINTECDNADDIESSIYVSFNEDKSMDEDITSSEPTYGIEMWDDKVQHGVEDISLPTDSDTERQHDREVLSTEVLIRDNSDNCLNGYSGSNSDTETCVQTLINSSSEDKALNQLKGQDENLKSMAEDISLRTGVSNFEDHANDGNIIPGLNSDNHSCIPMDSAADSSLEDKVAKFIHSGDLDVIEDKIYGGIINGSTEESKEWNEPENNTESQSKLPDDEDNNYAVDESDSHSALNESISIYKHIDPPVRVNHLPRNDGFSAEGLATSDIDKDMSVEPSKRENEIEIDNLKFMLHQKELELSRLKEHIEKEKLALSDLQTKAEVEISRAQKLISEKHAELLAAEESLSGLVEVKIQYKGDCEIVEVAGSFNGWHHRIKMDPEQPSSNIDPAGSRKPKLWSTMLWLYPGVYEIKFIVDGHWTIDPQTEMVSRGGISNNVLRVVG